MFGIAWTELLVILAIALLVIGPKDLPRVLYSIGKFSKKIKTFTGDIQKSLEGVMQDEELADIVREANKAGGDNLSFELERQAAEEARRQNMMQPLPPAPDTEAVEEADDLAAGKVDHKDKETDATS